MADSIKVPSYLGEGQTDDKGKVDFREQVRDSLGNVREPRVPLSAAPKPAEPADDPVADAAAAAEHDHKVAQERVMALAELLEVDLAAPPIMTLLRVHGATLKRRLPGGEYEVMGPLLKTPNVFPVADMFGAVNLFVSNAQRASHAHEMELRAKTAAKATLIQR